MYTGVLSGISDPRVVFSRQTRQPFWPIHRRPGPPLITSATKIASERGAARFNGRG